MFTKNKVLALVGRAFLPAAGFPAGVNAGKRLLPDINSNVGGRNFDAIDPIRQLERLIDHCVGIQRQKKRADQKIESRAAHSKTTNFDALQINRGPAFRRLESGTDLHRFFTPNQLRQQPVGFHPSGTPDFQKIDEREADSGVAP